MAELEGMRLNKFLSAAGYCSRREADRLIEEGKVRVDGVTASLGDIVMPGSKVVVNGKNLGGPEKLSEQKQVLIAVNKPVGVVCTTTDNDRAVNIVELVDYPQRVYPIGRLDKDSEGLLLLTNRGELVNAILRAANYHEKEYLVRVDQPLTEGFVDKMRRGVHLNELQITTRPCRLTIVDKNSFRIVLTQGLNRQIRRMCEALGFHVVSLKRIRIMNITLGSLKPATWRNVRPDELKELERLLKLAEQADGSGHGGDLAPGKKGGHGAAGGTYAGRSGGSGKSGKPGPGGPKSGRSAGSKSAGSRNAGSKSAGSKSAGTRNASEARQKRNYQARQKEFFRNRSRREDGT